MVHDWSLIVCNECDDGLMGTQRPCALNNWTAGRAASLRYSADVNIPLYWVTSGILELVAMKRLHCSEDGAFQRTVNKSYR